MAYNQFLLIKGISVEVRMVCQGTLVRKIRASDTVPDVVL